MGIRDFIRDFGILLGFSEKPNSRIKSRIPSQVEPLEETDAEITKELSPVDSDGFSDPPPQMSEECKSEHEKFKAADNRSRCFATKRFQMEK